MEKKMKIILGISLTFLVSIYSIKPETQTIQGDLYYSFFRIGSYYNQTENEIEAQELFFDTLDYSNADADEKKLYNQYNKLKKLKLLYSPFVDIKINDSSIIKLYLDSSAYNQFKTFNRVQLQTDSNKVLVQARVNEIDEGLFYCVELLKTEITLGTTLSSSKKFLIEDYK